MINLVATDLFADSPFPKVNWGSLVVEREEKTVDDSFEPLSVGQMGVTPQLESVARPKDPTGRKIVRKGDIVINSRSDRRGASGVSGLEGAVSVVYSVMSPKTDALDPRFAGHLLKSDMFQDTFYLAGVGIVDDLWTTNFNRMSSIRVPLPPLRIQRAIADYLDRETAEIDAMTADLDKMEALLTERRAEILRSWFGEQLKNPRAPLATIAELYIGKMEQPRQKSADEIYAPFFHSANIRPGGMIDLECSVKHMWFRPDELDHMLLRKGDVVVVEGGAAGRPGYIAKSVDGWGIQKSVIRARPFEDKVIGKYLFYALTFAFEDGQFDLQASLATLAHFPAEKAARFRVPVRSLADQELVVARLDRDLSSLSDMLADITELRDLLAERRAALIAAAVTGQIDIPTAEEPTHA